MRTYEDEMTKGKRHPGKKGNPLIIPLSFEEMMEGIVKVKPWPGMKKRAKRVPQIRTPRGPKGKAR